MPTYSFDLQITPGSMPPILHMAQYDSGRTYYASLKNGVAAYTPANGSTAKIKGRNAAGVCWEQEATISSSTVEFTPEGAATDQFGIMPVQLELTESDGVISTLLIIFDIQRAGYTNEEAASSPEFQTAMEAAAAEAVGDAVVWRANQAAKTDAMTNPIGIDEDGKLWAEPGSGGSSNAVQYVAQSLTTSQKAQARTNIGAGTGSYSKPSGGIPASDLATYETTITGSGGSYTANHSFSDILSAYNSGKQLRFFMGDLIFHMDEITSSYIALHGIDASVPSAPNLIELTITATGVAGAVRPIGNANTPTVVTVTGNTPTIAEAQDNTIYDCTGTGITSLTITARASGAAFTVIFDAPSGSTPPSFTYPTSNMIMPDGFAVEVYTHYEINVDSKGFAVVGAWSFD